MSVETTVNIVAIKQKSNAPWILGIIAFVTSLPNLFCAFLCAGATTAVAAAAAEEEGAVEEAASAAAGYFWLVVLVSIVCFILSFMGKSKSSVVTGILLILGALFILVNGFIGLGSMLWGTVTGILYLVAGIVSILNQKRPA